MFLVYGGEDELGVKGYTDASYLTDSDDSRSQSGYVFVMNGGAVSWKSSKQGTVSASTTEAEYIAASEAAKEAVWIRNFLIDLGVVQGASNPLDVYCDNNVLSHKPRNQDNTRRTNIYSCVTTSFASLSRKVISSYARYTRMQTLRIR